MQFGMAFRPWFHLVYGVLTMTEICTEPAIDLWCLIGFFDCSPYTSFFDCCCFFLFVVVVNVVGKCQLMLVCVNERDDNDAVEKISEILPKMHSIVIGPGLGRDCHLLSVVKVCHFHTLLWISCAQTGFLSS